MCSVNGTSRSGGNTAAASNDCSNRDHGTDDAGAVGNGVSVADSRVDAPSDSADASVKASTGAEPVDGKPTDLRTALPPTAFDAGSATGTWGEPPAPDWVSGLPNPDVAPPAVAVEADPANPCNLEPDVIGLYNDMAFGGPPPMDFDGCIAAAGGLGTGGWGGVVAQPIAEVVIDIKEGADAIAADPVSGLSGAGKSVWNNTLGDLMSMGLEAQRWVEKGVVDVYGDVFGADTAAAHAWVDASINEAQAMVTGEPVNPAESAAMAVGDTVALVAGAKAVVDWAAIGVKKLDDLLSPSPAALPDVPNPTALGAYPAADYAQEVLDLANQNGLQIIALRQGSKGNWNADLNGPLQPNAAYFLENSHAYITDELGRVTQAGGVLDLSKVDRNTYQQLVVGRLGGPGYDGGHLLATMFGGAGEKINLVAQLSEVNRGRFRVMEEALAARLTPTSVLKVEVIPVYSGSSVVPDQLVVRGSLDGVPFDDKLFDNKP